MKTRTQQRIHFFLTVTVAFAMLAGALSAQLPDPDGKLADTRQPKS